MNDDENSVKFENVIQHFHDHSNVIIVEIDTRMKSDQLQIIRMKLRGRAILLKGKNTLIKSAIRNLAQDIQFNVKPSERKHNPESLLKICEYLNGNVGLIFTNSTEIEELIEQIQSFKFETRAKVGERSPRNIYIRSGFTATIPVPILAPMFQQLGIVFRTIVGQVESCRDCLILSEGEKIGKMQADLLEMLDMMPVIEYGLKVLNYYENSPVVWNRSYMKLMNLTTTPELNKLVQEAMDNVASIGLELDIPNSASIPHSILNGLMNICSINVDLGTGESISQFTIYELPSEILILIGSFLNLSELNRFAKVNQSLLSLFFNRRIDPQSDNSGALSHVVDNITSIVNEESSAFERVQLEIWKPLVCFYFPNFNGNNLNIKNWLYVLRRRINHIKIHNPTINISKERNKYYRIKEYEWNLVNQCECIYKCPLKFESLQVYKNSNRFCNVCDQVVYQVDNEEQAKDHIVEVNCFAFVKIEQDDDLLYEHEIEPYFNVFW